MNKTIRNSTEWQDRRITGFGLAIFGLTSDGDDTRKIQINVVLKISTQDLELRITQHISLTSTQLLLKEEE